MIRKPYFYLLLSMVLGLNITSAQISETFTKTWPATSGGSNNFVEADTRDDEAFYVAFEVRKFEMNVDYYTFVEKLNCEGETDWRLGIETLGSVDELIDMAVLSDGSIGILQQAESDELQLHWLSRSGSPRTSLSIELGADSEPWRLIPHPTGASFMIVMGYDITNTNELVLLQVDESGSALLSASAGDYNGPVEGAAWPTDAQILLQSGNEIRIADLNTSQSNGRRLPDLNTGSVDLYLDGNTIYLSYIANNQLNILKFTNLVLQWHKVQSSSPGFRHARIEQGSNGPVLVAERGSDVIFEGIDTDGNLIGAYRILDGSFQSVVSDFHMDGAGNWLYTGSDATGQDDYVARLNAQSNCVDNISVSIEDSDSDIESLNFPDLAPQSFTISSVSTNTYSDFPPADYLCRVEIENLRQIFKDTIVKCDTALVINHGLSNDYQLNGAPLQNPMVIDEPGVYSVSIERCNMTEQVDFEVEFDVCNCQWYFPNTFTPNGDGINEVFLPEGECLQSGYQMQIFDRWGNLVFESRSPLVGWEGKYNEQASNPGVYVYVIRYTPVPSTEEQVITGTITLMR